MVHARVVHQRRCQVAFPEYLWPLGIIINNPSQHSPPYKYEEIISCATSIHALIEIRPGWVCHQHTYTESVVLLCSDGPNIQVYKAPSRMYIGSDTSLTLTSGPPHGGGDGQMVWCAETSW